MNIALNNSFTWAQRLEQKSHLS